MVGSHATTNRNSDSLVSPIEREGDTIGFELTVKQWYYLWIFKTKFCGVCKKYSEHKGQWNSMSAWARPWNQITIWSHRLSNQISLACHCISRDRFPGFVFLSYIGNDSGVWCTFNSIVHVSDWKSPLEQCVDINKASLGALSHISWIYRINKGMTWWILVSHEGDQPILSESAFLVVKVHFLWIYEGWLSCSGCKRDQANRTTTTHSTNPRSQKKQDWNKKQKKSKKRSKKN